MRRNRKVLGLAIAGILTLSAISTSMASASTFTTGSDATIGHGEGIGAQVFTAGELEVVCKGVSGEGGEVGTEQEAITVAPVFFSGGCTMHMGGSEFTIQVDTEGCDYLVTAAGSVHLQCPSETSMRVTIFFLGQFRKCVDIAAQTPTVPTADYFNETQVVGGKNVWDVRVKSTAQGITYTKTGVCGEGTFNNFVYQGEGTIWGTNKLGERVNVTWDSK